MTLQPGPEKTHTHPHTHTHTHTNLLTQVCHTTLHAVHNSYAHRVSAASQKQTDTRPHLKSPVAQRLGISHLHMEEQHKHTGSYFRLDARVQTGVNWMFAEESRFGILQLLFFFSSAAHTA